MILNVLLVTSTCKLMEVVKLILMLMLLSVVLVLLTELVLQPVTVKMDTMKSKVLLNVNNVT